MSATIHVERSTPGRFRVTVGEGASQSEHAVTLNPAYYEKLTRKRITEEDLIQRSFQFLLEREPKESILRNFDLSIIKHYYPDYESKIQK